MKVGQGHREFRHVGSAENVGEESKCSAVLYAPADKGEVGGVLVGGEVDIGAELLHGVRGRGKRGVAASGDDKETFREFVDWEEEIAFV